MSQTTKPDRVLEALKAHKILADTSFLMDRNFAQFLSDYGPVLRQNRILIPKRVVQELQRLEKRNDHRLEAARKALTCVQNAVSQGMAEIRGDVSDDHTNADNVISRVVEQHIVHHSIVVLTNDRKLRDWVYAKKRSGCFSTKNSLLVIRFCPFRGTPHVWGRADHTGNGPPLTRSVPPHPRPSVGINRPNVPQPFARAKSIAPNLDTPLRVSEDVEKAGLVYRSGGRPVRLVSKLGSGGEGAVFETDQRSLLCKVYHPNRLTVGAQKKIELMTTRKVANPAICWPIEPVSDAQGVFRGFLMPRGSGDPLGHGLFIPTVWLKKRPNWTRRESVQLAICILEQIDYLHRMHVLLGDINPMNILVQDEKTIFFVDCDSFQVEGFPCPVGSPNFVAPEIQGVDFTRFLRTEEHELFAVATLLFMIMMPGKSPFSHQGGADGAANIRKMHFPYPLGERSSDRAPEGAWRFCWSHLTRPIKEAFYKSFHRDFKGQPRVQVADWLRLFREYERILNKDTEVFMGPVPQYGFDLSILPQNFRFIKGKGRPLPTGGQTDLQRSVQRMAASSRRAKPRPAVTHARTWQTASPTSKAPQITTPGSPYGSGTPTKYPASPPPSPTCPNSGTLEWYANPVVWSLVAPFKALFEVLSGTALGGIVGAVLFGVAGLVLGALVGSAQKTMIGGLTLGSMIGCVLGTFGGIIAAGGSISKVDDAIFLHAGFGAAVGAVAVAFLAGSPWWAIVGAWLGLSGGLLVWRLSAGEQKADQYIKTWWAS
jgi:rRNA-processing protein FCF1/serine/threonine protein kinase